MPDYPSANPDQFIQGAPVLHVQDVLAAVTYYRDVLGFTSCGPAWVQAVVGPWQHTVNSAIELHDSVIGSIEPDGCWGVVSFTPAYFHWSEGQPGVDMGTGWVQDAKLWIGDAVVAGELPDLPCSITDGDLSLGLHAYPNDIPVPLDRHDIVELRVAFYPGCEIQIRGTSIRLELLGEPRYVEEFRP